MYGMPPMKIIVCMSTTPPRAPFINSVIESLLKQTKKPDEIRIYIPPRYKRFSDTAVFPKLPDNVIICPSEEDFGPATKILPALKEFPPDQILIYCDDDIDYDDGLIERLLLLNAAYPDSCIADQGRGWTRFVRDLIRDRDLLSNFALKICKPRRIGSLSHPQIDIAEGYGGVLVKPRFFPSSVYQIPAALWVVDDIWLSGCLAMTGTTIRRSSTMRMSKDFPLSSVEALRDLVTAGRDRNLSNTLGILHLRQTFGIWPFRSWRLENLLMRFIFWRVRKLNQP
jgi:glycosyltransferase involved in cell wall biosynthesis